jgi:hypothetical protein
MSRALEPGSSRAAARSGVERSPVVRPSAPGRVTPPSSRPLSCTSPLPYAGNDGHQSRGGIGRAVEALVVVLDARSLPVGLHLGRPSSRRWPIRRLGPGPNTGPAPCGTSSLTGSACVPRAAAGGSRGRGLTMTTPPKTSRRAPASEADGLDRSISSRLAHRSDVTTASVQGRSPTRGRGAQVGSRDSSTLLVVAECCEPGAGQTL